MNPSEITKLLKEQIKNFGNKAEVSEVGKVLTVGDGIVPNTNTPNENIDLAYELQD